jgi:hypothetical protein
MKCFIYKLLQFVKDIDMTCRATVLADTVGDTQEDAASVKCESVEPDNRNLCFVKLHERPATRMPGFCTIIGPKGDQHRENNCREMSTAGEWANPEVSGLCAFLYTAIYKEVVGPAWPWCSYAGGGLKCRRNSFTGDPVTCCFNDLACVSSPDNYTPECFSDVAQQNTCSDGSGGTPNHRSIVSEDCRDTLFEYCTGTLPTDDPNSVEWLDRWTVEGTRSCYYAVQRNMFDIGGTGHCFPPQPVPPGNLCNIPLDLPLDSVGFFWAQRLVSAAITKYTAQGFAIGSLPGFPGYNPWQDFMYNNVCCPYAGLCQDALEIACETKTAQRISLNPALAQWCGCHLPVGEYEEYSARFNIPPQCTPMCNRVGTIPIVGVNADPISCTQDICLIDGVTVNLINSQIGGGINFDQVCANCSGSQCSCIVSNTTVDIANSVIGGNVVPVSEGCGSISCTQTNPGTTGPNTIPVSCGETGPFNPYQEYEAEVAAATAEAQKKSWFWTILIVGAGILLIFIILIFLHPVYKPYITVGTGPVVTPPVSRTITVNGQ